MKKGFTETILNKKFRDYTKKEKTATVVLLIMGSVGFFLLIAGSVKGTSLAGIGLGIMAAALIVFCLIVRTDKDASGDDEEERFDRCLLALERIFGFDHEDMEAASEWYGIYEENDKTIFEMAIQSDFNRYHKLDIVNGNILFSVMTEEDQAKIRELAGLSERAEELLQDLKNDKCHCRIVQRDNAEGCVIFEEFEHRMVFIALERIVGYQP
ncbi:MAG: hypothetical protein J5859_00200 [Clostridia bacterium]|nr:hypothetical protein [Clostridia bacterium]